MKMHPLQRLSMNPAFCLRDNREDLQRQFKRPVRQAARAKDCFNVREIASMVVMSVLMIMIMVMMVLVTVMPVIVVFMVMMVLVIVMLVFVVFMVMMMFVYTLNGVYGCVSMFSIGYTPHKFC